MENKFEPGDLVQLKSGGPVMTIECTFENGSVRTQWFGVHLPRLHEGEFEVETLKYAKQTTTD